MERQDTAVRKAVREAVVKTAEEISVLSEKGKEAGGRALDTAKEAFEGFKEGIQLIRKGHKDGPMEILKKRYAGGDITKEEFDRMKKDLEH